MKIEPAVAGLLVGFVGAGASCLFLFYLNSIGLTSSDLSVQIFGWVMFVSLLIMMCVPFMRLESLKSAKGILKPLESER